MSELDLNNIMPDWEVVKLLGKGSFGEVYMIKREDMSLTFYSALKIIKIPQEKAEIQELGSDGMDEKSIRVYYKDLVQHLMDEIRVMESLKSAGNIVSIEDYKVIENANSIGWTIYIRMELLENLNQYLNVNPTLPVAEIVKIGKDISSALICCEQDHIIHRDIKPANVFRNRYGSYKLGDFGISRQLEKSVMAASKKGTGMYMAPEVYNGETYNLNVDIYSLGIMLYKLLNNGRFPFMPSAPTQLHFSDAEESMMRRMSGAPIPSPANDITPLTSIILKACSFNPADRYQKPEYLLNDLNGLSNSILTEKVSTGSGISSTERINSHGEADQTYVYQRADSINEKQTDNTTIASEISMKHAEEFQKVEENSKQSGVTIKQRKKNIVPLIIGIASVMTLILLVMILISVNNGKPQSSIQSQSISSLNSVVAQNADSTNLQVSQTSGDTFASMLWGTYLIDDSTGFSMDDFKKEAEYEKVEGGDNGEEKSTLPTRIEAMSGASYFSKNGMDWSTEEERQKLYSQLRSSGDETAEEKISNIKKLIELNVIQLTYLVRSNYNSGSEEEAYFAYEISGQTMTIYNVNVDSNTYAYTTSNPVEYTFSFDGANLIIERNGKKVTLAPWMLQEKTFHASGYVEKDEYAFHDIVGLGLDQEGSSGFVYFKDGSFSSDAQIKLSGGNTVTISWDTIYRKGSDVSEPGEVTVQYIAQYDTTNLGIILISDNKYYPYQCSEDDYYTNKFGYAVTPDEDNVSKNDLGTAVEKQGEILTDLKDELKSSAVNADIDETTGIVTMNNSILFDKDSAELSEDGKSYLQGFLDVYSSVIMKESNKSAISKIILEGHTDSDGTYEYNQQLSEKRANAVKDYCQSVQPELATLMEAKGCSYDDLILNEDGSENKDASRRVIFKFELKLGDE